MDRIIDADCAAVIETVRAWLHQNQIEPRRVIIYGESILFSDSTYIGRYEGFRQDAPKAIVGMRKNIAAEASLDAASYGRRIGR